MRTRTITFLTAAAVLLTAAAAWALAAQDAPSFLKGRVVTVAPAASLEQSVTAARNEFAKSKQGDVFFTAHLFPSRHSVHHSMCGHEGPFVVEARGTDIDFKGQGDEQNFESKDRPGPAGLLLLHSAARPGAGILSAHVLDPNETYEFKTVPVYWLGQAGGDPSLKYLEGQFERGGEEARESLVFAASLHDSPRTLDFLRRVALTPGYGTEVRQAAVFWTGETKDPRSLAILREVFDKAQDRELKKHVVFALTLPDSDEALKEIIRIAKTGSDQEVKKSAIFWLGQKATRETEETLKGIVSKPDENEEVKESAVFAISQLPKERSVPLLLAMARENKSLSIRKKAMFWLGQTDSDEALKLFEEILTKKGKS